MGKIVFIIPSLRPNQRLIQLVEKLHNFLETPDCKGISSGILVVDDGSGPQYQEIFNQIAQMPGCTVVQHSVNLGKGRALKTAFNHCLLHYPKATGVITLDSDGQHAPEDVLAYAKTLAGAPHSFILGKRDFSAPDVPFKSRYGNIITRQMFRLICGIKVTDTQTGLRGIPFSFLTELMNLPGERFEYEMNMLVECKKQEIPITEVPIQTIYIDSNESSHFNPILDAARIYLIFFKYIFSSLSSSLIDLTAFSLLLWVFKDLFPAYYIMAATVLARGVSSLYNYYFNKKLVFGYKGKSSSILRYYLLAVVQVFLSGTLVSFFFTLLPLPELPIKIVVDVFLFFISFQIQRVWVFASPKNK